ncbi:hypothetical protein XIS1_890003 [Xenorhabdus innexi]|uniref:Uncharacterized protein n=1 Tax=Xenorhabdus innexi TaxID=290109 RepID=A0A1N6N1A8_9GAMM|nr:hypothetical protein XIS1_890003 [Xenorhabdus innexi]
MKKTTMTNIFLLNISNPSVITFCIKLRYSVEYKLHKGIHDYMNKLRYDLDGYLHYRTIGNKHGNHERSSASGRSVCSNCQPGYK